jgi:hypothetical protein
MPFRRFALTSSIRLSLLRERKGRCTVSFKAGIQIGIRNYTLLVCLFVLCLEICVAQDIIFPNPSNFRRDSK